MCHWTGHNRFSCLDRSKQLLFLYTVKAEKVEKNIFTIEFCWEYTDNHFSLVTDYAFLCRTIYQFW